MQNRFSTLVLLIILCLLANEAQSQTNATIDDQLRNEYRGKTLLLRGFYSGKELRFDEQGGVLDGAVAGPWTLANVKITDIVATPQEIEIKGERLGYWFKREKDLALEGAGKIKITILRPGSDADALATARFLMKRVFLQGDENFCPLLPQYWQVFCAGEDAQAQKTAWMKILETNHLSPHNSSLKPANTPPAKLTAPRAEFHPDPSYTNEAAQHKIEGKTVLELVIDESGHPNAITILKPVGMGLDEEAVKGVSRWKFRPSMQDGKPVPVQINVEVNFRCCPFGWP